MNIFRLDFEEYIQYKVSSLFLNIIIFEAIVSSTLWKQLIIRYFFREINKAQHSVQNAYMFFERNLQKIIKKTFYNFIKAKQIKYKHKHILYYKTRSQNKMGSECSNLYDQLTQQTNPRNKIIDFISATAFGKNNTEKSLDFDNYLDLKLDFVKNIQWQIIKEGQKNICSYQKYPESKLIVKFNDGSQYKGYINDKGKRQKQGQQIWSDGTKYNGNWKQNLPDGQGYIVNPNGFTFQGHWIRGVVQGFGKYYGKLGSYEGEWKWNQPHGLGLQTWQDGSKYDGNYKFGKKQGKGQYTWPDKSVYNGNWLNGKIQGEGIYRYLDGRVYKGSFKNNKMHGQGTYSWTDGRKYIGSYENDKKQGHGLYYWPDGRYYDGQWRNGKRSGYGKIVYPNGLIKYGVWDDDNKIQQRSHGKDKLSNHAQSTFIYASQQKNELEKNSPSFVKNSGNNSYGSFTKKQNIQQSRRSLTIPKIEGKPLYASSMSPYKQLKQYYDQYNDEAGDLKARIENRYKFINSPFRKFNQLQMRGQKTYSSLLRQKVKNSNMRKSKGQMTFDRKSLQNNNRSIKNNEDFNRPNIYSRHKRVNSVVS